MYDHITQELRLPNVDFDYVDISQSSPFCDVLGKNLTVSNSCMPLSSRNTIFLGRQQRKWFREVYSTSKAKIKIILSSSVLLDKANSSLSSYLCGMDVITHQSIYCRCGGDNLDCYSVAQLELLSIIAGGVDSNAQENINLDNTNDWINIFGSNRKRVVTSPDQTFDSCVIVLTGDYHFSDIKSLLPGTEHTYSQSYHTENNKYPVYQVMASGMSTSTGVNFTCDDYRLGKTWYLS